MSYLSSEKTEIEGDLTCAVCGYNLRTLRAGALCPECGTPVRRTTLGIKINENWHWKVKLGLDLMWWATIFGMVPVAALTLPTAFSLWLYLFLYPFAVFIIIFLTVLTVAGLSAAFLLITLKESPHDPNLTMPLPTWVVGLRWLLILGGAAYATEILGQLFELRFLGNFWGTISTYTLVLIGNGYCVFAMWLLLYFLREPIRHTADFVLDGQIKMGLWVLPFIFVPYLVSVATSFVCLAPLLAGAGLLWFGYLVWQARQTF